MNLDEAEIQFECPQCGFINSVRIRQVRLEDQIICDGCLETIHLRDDAASTARAVDDIQQALDSLEDTIRRL